MSPFQIIIGAIFVFSAIVGVILFATFDSIVGGNFGTVEVWGTVDEGVVADILTTLRETDDRMQNVAYVERSADTFEEDLINTLATGAGPDLVLLPHTMLLKHRDKFVPIDPSLISERDVRDGYIDEAQLLITEEGALGVPIVVDPLVMYFNRNLLSAAGIAEAPRFWDQVQQATQVLTVSDDRGGVSRSAVALGTADNIRHSKDILATLLMQSGSAIAERREGRVVVSLQERQATGISAGEAALRFYTQFADPARPTYSWNRALPEARNAFSSGTLALYLGFASELATLRASNPNLNFDTALIPQERTRTPLTYGNMFVFAVPRAAQNPNSGMVTAAIFASPGPASVFARELGLPSAVRSLLVQIPSDPFQVVFRNAALISRGWYDVNAERTEIIFNDMIDGIVSGRLGISEALSQSEALLDRLVDQ